MDLEFVAIMLAVGLALLPIAWRSGSRRVHGALVAIWAAIGLTAAPGIARYRTHHAPVEPVDRPVEHLRDDYVSSKECGACHPGEYDSWRHSWHRTMTQVASPASVVADFDGTKLELRGVEFELKQKGDAFLAHFVDPETHEATWHKIVLTTGSHNQQSYWYFRGRDRPLGFFPFTYLLHDRRWIPGESTFLQPPTEVQNAGKGSWNSNCIHCHTTRGRPRLMPAMGDESTSDAVEFGIACEACHGPGRAHAEANRANPARRYQHHVSRDPDQTVVNAMHLPPARSAEVCGQCHGISENYTGDNSPKFDGYNFRPGEVLGETNRVILRGGDNFPHPPSEAARVYHDTLFWPDGMVRVSGREMNGLLESPCYEAGEMTCLSCHDLHKSEDDPRSFEAWADDQLAPGMRTNEACLQCHETYRETASAHSHHLEASSGNQCLNCHMPYTTWGLMKAIRQHTVDSPSVTTSVLTGRINACNACHLDQTLAWSRQWLSTWYGQPEADLSEEETSRSSVLLALFRGDARQRALSAWYLGWRPARETAGGDWIAAQLAVLLDDRYDIVRYIAGRSLAQVEGFERFDYDFLAPIAEREKAVLRARERYERLRAGRTRKDEADFAKRVLLYEDGTQDRVALKRLLAQRDDHDVIVRE